ncbi:glycosyltransferase [Vibrio navarrensis]|uniref:glycosyltransferase n=1 Tax=Vibrio navarrensis TaxID=29495 RepID=UPI00155837C2|nr:glycosyltransferase [Vibrio navarrensis]
MAEEGHKVSIVIDRNRVAFPLHENVKVYHLKNFSLKDVTPVYQGDTQHFQQHLKTKSEKKAKNKLKLRDKYPIIQKNKRLEKYLLKLFTFPSKYLVIRKFMSEFKPDKIASHTPYIIKVSSLAPGKRIERTIKAFQKFEREDLLLLVLGEGSERDKLESLTKELNLTDRVIFNGFVENPLPFMKSAELMSFTSDYESFGQVIVECLATGTPVVSTNCPHCPSDILIKPLDQYLVEIDNQSEDSIVDKIKAALQYITHNKITIKEDSLNKFKKNLIIKQWELFKSKNHGQSNLTII